MHRPLTQNDLLPDGPLARLGSSVHVFAEIDSTNRFLLDQAASLPDGAVASANYQSAGRGRLGHAWVAARGSSILLSVLLHEAEDSPLVRLAALVGALAACQAVEECTPCQPRLRWPNDLVLRRRKLGGVLAEATRMPDRRRGLVIGVGINCLQHRGHFPPELHEKATSLEIESDQPIHRAPLAARLVACLDRHAATIASRPDCVDLWRQAWQRHSDDLGQHVQLVEDGQVYSGTIVELAAEGDLIVQLEVGGRRRFSAQTASRVW